MNIIAARLLHPDFGANYFDSLQPDVLVALTPKNHNIRVIHIEKDRFDFNKECDLLLLIFITSYAPTAYKIADEFRKRGTTVVLGGAHASALPDEAKQHADSVVIGEAEETWPQLLKDFEKGKLKPFYRQTRPVDLSTIQVYNRKYTPGSSGKIVVEATRGCPVGCSFCAITNTSFGRTYRERPIEHVINEVETIPQKFLFFCDASLTADPEYTKQLFKEMKHLNKRFACYGTVNVLANDEQLLKIAKKAGCVQWYIGFESIYQENIDYIGKTTNRVEEYESAVRKIHDQGMTVVGSFIFGFEYDTPKVFDETLKTVYNLKLDAAEFNILLPLPGTPIFNQLKRDNRIVTDDWSDFTYGRVIFKPKNMSREELQTGFTRVVKNFYSPPKMSDRFLRILRSFDISTSMTTIFTNMKMRSFYRRLIKDISPPTD